MLTLSGESPLICVDDLFKVVMNFFGFYEETITDSSHYHYVLWVVGVWRKEQGLEDWDASRKCDKGVRR